MRILMVDDEPANLRILQEILRPIAGVEVVATCTSGPEAVARVRDLRPDLLFLDIHMPVMSGFEVLEELADGPLPLVVFVTAFDQYALRAFSIHAVDYLLKPAEATAVQAALARARLLLDGGGRRNEERRVHELLDQVERERPRLARFVVREGDRILFIRTAEVEAIEATGNYMHLYVGRTSHMIRETMGRLEAGLDPYRFLRTHKSWLVNVEKIREIVAGTNGMFTIHLAGGGQAPVSRRFRGSLNRFLRGSDAGDAGG